MKRIHGIRKQTDNRFLNLYAQDITFRDGSKSEYYVASRRMSPQTLKSATHDNEPDGVIVCATHGDKLVLIRQYRYPIDGYVYELPAGAIDPGESIHQAAVREMLEETGLDFVPEGQTGAFYMSVGMTDESCVTVFGHCSGTPCTDRQEISEDIQVVLADKAECRRILDNEPLGLPCGYAIMRFLATAKDSLV